MYVHICKGRANAKKKNSSVHHTKETMSKLHLKEDHKVLRTDLNQHLRKHMPLDSYCGKMVLVCNTVCLQLDYMHCRDIWLHFNTSQW